MADLWADVRRQSVATQTQPRTVRSPYGGRHREVTVVWPSGERGLWRHDAVRGLRWLGLWAVVGLLSVVAVWLVDRYVLDDGTPVPAGDDDPAYGILLFAAFVVLSLAATGMGLVVAFVRDVRGRRRPDIVEGAVVLRERVAVLGDGDVVHRHYLAVDDGTSETVTATLVHPGAYGHVTVGDGVRLVLAGGTRRLLRMEALHDAAGQPLPPLGTMPATPPDAPVTTGEVAAAIGRTVRRLEVTTAGDGDVPVWTWTFHLVDDGPTDVQVHLSSGGERGADAIVSMADPEDRSTRRVSGLGDTAHRYRVPSLLVVRSGPVTIAVQKSAFLAPPHTWWDEELARKALTRVGLPHLPRGG